MSTSPTSFCESHRADLRRMKSAAGLLRDIACSSEENQQYEALLKNGQELPQGVFRYRSEDSSLYAFYTVEEADFTDRELLEYFLLKQAQAAEERQQDLRTIRKCVVFFTALTVIGMVLAFIGGLMIGL